MIYGYIRISEYENDMDKEYRILQEEQLANAGVEHIYIDEDSIVETHRPGFEELMDNLKNGDTLVVTKLDRIASNIRSGEKLISSLIERGVIVHILNVGIMDNTENTCQIRNTFRALAEFEHERLVERVRAGKYYAKLDEDYKEGRPKTYSEDEMKKALKLLEKYSYKQVTEMTGISKSTLIRAKRQKERYRLYKE